jgi:hypothetical protein
MRTFWIAVSSVKGGNGGRLSAMWGLPKNQQRYNVSEYRTSRGVREVGATLKPAKAVAPALQAQREACEAFINSQWHEGWESPLRSSSCRNWKFARLSAGGREIRTSSGPTFKEERRTPSSPLRFFSAQLHPLRSFLISKNDDFELTASPSNLGRRASEETSDEKADRKDGTRHRFDRRGRPARRSQARASRRARARAWS